MATMRDVMISAKEFRQDWMEKFEGPWWEKNAFPE